MRPALIVAVVAAAVVAVAAVALGVTALTDEGVPDGEEVVIRVPPGTGERIDAGEDLELIPQRLELSVGDTLVIVNDDDRTHVVGPYGVPAGQELRTRFTEPGTYYGACTLHVGDRVEIVIS